LSADIAVDLGTANTLVYVKGEGLVLNEPSVVALDADTNELLAVGLAAKQMYGKTSRRIKCVRPIKDGVIADFGVTTEMIKHMLKVVRHRWSLVRPRAVIGVPSDITQVEKRAVLDAALSSGVRQVFLVEESMAAAVGSGLPIDQPIGSMVVDIGGGTTEIAILSLGGTVYSYAIRIAGDEMDEGIQRYIRQRCGLEISIFEADDRLPPPPYPSPRYDGVRAVCVNRHAALYGANKRGGSRCSARTALLHRGSDLHGSREREP
jgi:rod shape-determining protein MreB